MELKRRVLLSVLYDNFKRDRPGNNYDLSIEEGEIFREMGNWNVNNSNFSEAVKLFYSWVAVSRDKERVAERFHEKLESFVRDSLNRGELETRDYSLTNEIFPEFGMGVQRVSPAWSVGYRVEGDTLYVKKGYEGLVIGKKGANIKALSSLFGKRLRVKGV